MVDLGQESDYWGSERVVGFQDDVQVEDAPAVRALLWAKHLGFEVVHVEFVDHLN